MRQNTNTKRLAIIASGGGMSCSYSAGVLCAIAKEHNIKKPDLLLGGSGSAGTLTYYALGEYDSIEKTWTQLLATKTFINPLRIRKIIDIDYLIDTVFKEMHPIQEEIFHQLPSEIIIGATNCSTGDISYFSNRDRVDFYEVLRATKALPIVYNKRIKLGEREFFDSFLSSSPYLYIKKAIEEGATQIILLDTSTTFPSYFKFLLDFWLKRRGKIFYNNYKKIQKEIIAAEKDLESTNFFVIKPGRGKSSSLLEHNPQNLKKSFLNGYNDCKNNLKLKQLLDEYS